MSGDGDDDNVLPFDRRPVRGWGFDDERAFRLGDDVDRDSVFQLRIARVFEGGVGLLITNRNSGMIVELEPWDMRKLATWLNDTATEIDDHGG